MNFTYKISDFNKVYGVSITFLQENKEESKLTYEFHIRVLDSKYKNSLISFNRVNLKLNESKPQYGADVLAQRCSEALYPINVRINEKMQIQNIENFDEITSRWKIIKQRIEQEISSKTEATKSYLNEMDKSMLSYAVLFNSLQKDLFLALLTTPIYTTAIKKEKAYLSHTVMPIIPYLSPVKYRIDQRTVGDTTSYNTIPIELTGSIDDERSANDIVTRSPIATGVGEHAIGFMNASYQLNSESHIIESIIANCSIKLPHGQSRGIKLTAFHQEDLIDK